MTSENKKPNGVCLGGRFFLNVGGGRIRWSFASDAGGMTADTACLCVSSPGSSFFLVLPIIGNWRGGHGGAGGQWRSCLWCSIRQRRGWEFEAFVPYSNFLLELLGCFTNFSKSTCLEFNASQSQTYSSSCISYLREWRRLVPGYPSTAVILSPSFSHVPGPACSWPQSWMTSAVLVPTEPDSLPVPGSALLLLPGWLPVMPSLLTAQSLALPHSKSAGHTLPVWSL